MAPHVTPQGLADGELQTTYRTLVDLWLHRRGLLVEIIDRSRPLVAGTVAAESLKGCKLAVACLTLENAITLSAR